MILRRRVPTLLCLSVVFTAGCGEEPTSEFPPLHFAVAYGVIEQNGTPVSGLDVRGEVFTSACPVTDALTSDQTAKIGLGGTYRLLLVSDSDAAGQCLRLTAAGASPVVQTLSETPFSALLGNEVKDSVRIDLTVP